MVHVPYYASISRALSPDGRKRSQALFWSSKSAGQLIVSSKERHELRPCNIRSKGTWEETVEVFSSDEPVGPGTLTCTRRPTRVTDWPRRNLKRPVRLQANRHRSG